MANKSLFRSLVGKLIGAADARNHEGAPAYALSPKQTLAQYVATGCLNGTFYASADEQLQQVLALCAGAEPLFVAKLAVYARQAGHMKDMPALLCAALSLRSPELLARVFDRVIDNGRMLRTFVQIVRSGAVGRKSLGTRPRRLVQRWLAARSDGDLFADSVGQSPSIADVVKMVHPRPATASRAALYAYLIGRDHDPAALPPEVRAYEDYKAGRRSELPGVSFQLLTGLPLGEAEWTEIARRAPWQMTRMNLSTFARHGVFRREGMAELIATRLSDGEAIARARVFPYQLLVAYATAGAEIPASVRDALQDAMELAIGNVPTVSGKVYVCPDVSGSMSSPVTGYRRGATTAVRCVDVAALVAAALLRKNPDAEVLPFEHRLVNVQLSTRDSVMTNASKLAAVGGGGTSCSAPLRELNRRRARGDLVLYVSDNESWVDAGRGRGTATMQEWSAFRSRNPRARLVCLDIQPYGTTQAAEREDVLNVGGFSDEVFAVIARFADGRLQADHWVGQIEEVSV